MKMKTDAAKRKQEPHERKIGQPHVSASHTRGGLMESRELATPKGSKGRESTNGDARNVRTMSSIEAAMLGDLLR
mgnify:CR=1 FL=1